MKIAAVCITWRRPKLLGRLIECFNRQTYENRELVILDDSGQYPSQPSGDRWRMVSVGQRFRTIGEKRNAAAALASGDVAAYAVWDDDDTYLPWALEASVHALQSNPWVQPRQTLEWDSGGTWHRQETFSRERPDHIAYHGCWSYLREAFINVGGYPAAVSEDWDLARRMRDRYGPAGDTICGQFPAPFYAYSRQTSGTWHMSERGANDSAYKAALAEPFEVVEKLEIGWDRDYTAIPIPPEVHRRPW
jgi:glycosyltransferase involved in cell wall biosynthesis